LQEVVVSYIRLKVEFKVSTLGDRTLGY